MPRKPKSPHMSSPPVAVNAKFNAALPKALNECTIFPPSSLCAVRVWNVLTFAGKAGAERDEPNSPAILHSLVRSRLRVSIEKRQTMLDLRMLVVGS